MPFIYTDILYNIFSAQVHCIIEHYLKKNKSLITNLILFSLYFTKIKDQRKNVLLVFGFTRTNNPYSDTHAQSQSYIINEVFLILITTCNVSD